MTKHIPCFTAQRAPLIGYAQVTLHQDHLVGPSPYGDGVVKMASKLALRGGWLGPSEFHLPAKPYCVSPVLLGRLAGPKHGLKRSIEASMFVPCRKCSKCLKFRRLHWRQRMENETLKAPGRTWFVTLTVDPILLAGILSEAALLDPSLSYIRRVDNAAYRHVQRYIKRVRKDGARFRYIFVFELGEQTGRPHYHALVHEEVTGSVTYRGLRYAWPSIVHAKLLDEKRLITLRYVSKYLGKSLDIRPRASLSYGCP